MKKIGLIGFKSGVSTAKYAELIKDLCKLHGYEGEAELVLSEISFNEFEVLRKRGRWDVIQNMLEAVVKDDLKEADFCVIASIYTHRLYQQLVENTGMKILHAADPVGRYLNDRKISDVLLLGVKETITEDFFSSILEEKYNINVMVPARKQSWQIVDDAIYEYLREGKVSQKTKNIIEQIVLKGQINGAQALLQASTELPQIFSNDQVPGNPFLVLDVMKIHAEAAVKYALETE